MVSKDATLTITFYMDTLLKILENNYQQNCEPSDRSVCGIITVEQTYE